MPSEDFDKKIKLAAEQHHPAYDEKAWLKMEKLLSRYLPQQKNNRRKVFFFLLAFLIIGGGTFLIISKPWNRAHFSEELPQSNKNKVQEKNPESANKSEVTHTDAEIDKTRSSELINENLTAPSHIKVAGTDKSSATHTLPHTQKMVPETVIKNQPAGNEQKNIEAGEENRKTIEPSDNMVTPKEKNNENKINDASLQKEVIKENTEKQVVSEQLKKAPQKNKSNNKNGFGFFISAGPDVSKAGKSKTGKTTFLYGAGVGYTKNRFTLRTGLYTSKKIYWAGPNEYKLSYVPPPSIQFEGADADCHVIQVPVRLTYNFGMRNSSNWFAGGGLSSYFMKREKYRYIYKTTSGSPYYHNYLAENENRHYFSILNLSLGYTHHINHLISLTAEPYVEIPLTGIGSGKVHLNSGGILFSIGVHPFKKR